MPRLLRMTAGHDKKSVPNQDQYGVMTMLNKRKLIKTLLATLMLAALPAAADNPPEGMVDIHYHRPDGKYENWGLHAWKRAPGASDQPLEGVSWFSPLTPTGKDEFGVYWRLAIKDFGSTGKVHYIIHKGDVKEQKGKDMSFDTKEIKDAYVVSGNPAIFKSKAEAQAAVGK